MLLIAIEKIFSNRDYICKAREAFFIKKGRTIDPDSQGLLILLPFVMLYYYFFRLILIFSLHCQLFSLISGITQYAT